MRKTQARKVKKFPQYKEPINILKEVQKKKKRGSNSIEIKKL